MKALTDVELNSILGGDDFEWDDFFGTLGWVLGASCAVTLNLAVCGAAIVVGGINAVF